MVPKGLRVSFLEIPPEGTLISQEVGAAELDLPKEDGRLHRKMRCEGSLCRTGDSSAYFEGRVSGDISRDCVRCLAEFDEVLDLLCKAVFKKSAKSAQMDGPRSKKKKGKVDEVLLDDNEPEEETYPIVDNHIDLLSALREHVILATPVQPLCKENCEGLCQVCGANLNKDMCGCYTPVTPSLSSITFEQGIFSRNQPKRPSKSVRKRR